MPDGIIYIVLLLTVFVLVCLAAHLYRRRLRARVQIALDLRYRQWRALLILYGIILALTGVSLFQQHHQSIINKTWPLIFQALAFGSVLFLFLHARKKLREQPGFVRQKTKRLPQFFWQAVFILLPVVGLAWIGLYSLRQDRLLAEQEAQATGEVLAQQLAQAVGTEAAQSLRDYYGASSTLNVNWTCDLGLSGCWGGPQSESNAWQRIKDWQQANPEIDLATLPPVENGYYDPEPEQMPPQPAEWLGQLDPEQQQLWQSAKESEFIVKDFSAVQAAIQKFIASKPPKGARANAEYLLLLAKTRGLAASNAVPQIAEFFRSHWGNSSESTDAGLPVGQLICYQALHRLPDGAGLPEDFVRSHTIAWMIQYRASCLSPILIAETERVVRGTSQEHYAASLKAWWNANAAARTVLQDFREQHPTNTWKTAPFWVDSRIGKYLLILGDRWVAPTNWVAPSEPRYSYLMLPQAVVENALATAVRKSNISLPPYARVEFEMAGKEIALSRREAADATNGVLPALGQAGGAWEHLPLNLHSYPFRIRVSLASSDILYARQSQRTRLFGALIVASAAAAVMGLFAAWRSFRRQQELNELKTNFVSSVSHELRAPIASVRLMAENLEGGKIPDALRQGEYFRFIVQECRRLSSLVENVLDFSRIEQGRKQYEFEPTDLVALVQATVRLMEPCAAEKGVKLETLLAASKQSEDGNIEHPTSLAAPKPGEGGNIELNVDGRAIQQALVNLIDNAIKHSPKGETVTVGMEVRGQRSEVGGQKREDGLPDAPRTTHRAAFVEDERRERGRGRFAAAFNPQPPGAAKRPAASKRNEDGNEDGSTLNLFVADQGPGIPPEEHDKIFERFYRRGSELRRETQGVGIGLSIVKHIAEAHGGRVRVESAVGQGSRFVIELPFVK